LSAVCAYGVEDAQKALLAKEIGFHLGKTIYLLDACDDYQKDKKHNRYNPFVLANEDPYQNELIRTSIRMECRAAYQALQLLDVTDDGVFAILENLLALGIPKETDRVLALIDSKKEKDRIERKAEP
jgi:hypothetical protein